MPLTTTLKITFYAGKLMLIEKRMDTEIKKKISPVITNICLFLNIFT